MGYKQHRVQGLKRSGESTRHHAREQMRGKLIRGETLLITPTIHFAQGCGCDRCRTFKTGIRSAAEIAADDVPPSRTEGT
jgi:hypothetical protein